MYRLQKNHESQAPIGGKPRRIEHNRTFFRRKHSCTERTSSRSALAIRIARERRDARAFARSGPCHLQRSPCVTLKTPWRGCFGNSAPHGRSEANHVRPSEFPHLAVWPCHLLGWETRLRKIEHPVIDLPEACLRLYQNRI